MPEQPRITIEISPGELADRYTIARLKVDYITEGDKRQYIMRDINYLMEMRSCMLGHMTGLHREKYLRLEGKLQQTNKKLWANEDRIRNREVTKEPKVGLRVANAIHTDNDTRYSLKVAINELLNVPTLEQKSYNYGTAAD